jgi:hypothetical protein
MSLYILVSTYIFSYVSLYISRHFSYFLFSSRIQLRLKACDREAAKKKGPQGGGGGDLFNELYDTHASVRSQVRNLSRHKVHT